MLLLIMAFKVGDILELIDLDGSKGNDNFRLNDIYIFLGTIRDIKDSGEFLNLRNGQKHSFFLSRFKFKSKATKFEKILLGVR